jgi:hypothetical protein
MINRITTNCILIYRFDTQSKRSLRPNQRRAEELTFVSLSRTLAKRPKQSMYVDQGIGGHHAEVGILTAYPGLEARACHQVPRECPRTQGGGPNEKICWRNWTRFSRYVNPKRMTGNHKKQELRSYNRKAIRCLSRKMASQVRRVSPRSLEERRGECGHQGS